MSWVINTFAKILLSVLSKLFGFAANSFIKMFGINIGAKFPKIGESGSSLVKVLNTYGKGDSIFDMLFPMGEFKKLFVVLAVTIATGLLILELVKAIGAPMTRGRKQHPLTSVVKYFIAIPGVFLSYRIFIVLEYIGNGFYNSFGKVAMNKLSVPKGSLTDMFATTGSGKLISNGLTMLEIGAESSGGWVLTGIAATVVNLLIVWLVFTNFFRLMIEIMERYLVLGALFYTSPLPFSALASEESSGIFWSWLKMVLSQMLLLITNGMFVSVFLVGLTKLSITQGEGFVGIFKSLSTTFGISGQVSWIMYMLLLVAWLLLAQRFDSYLNSLGLSTARTGGGLASSVRSGVMAVAGVAMAAGKSWRNSDTRKNAASAASMLDKNKTTAQGLANAASKKIKSAVGMDTTANNRRQASMNAKGIAQRELTNSGERDLAKQLGENKKLSDMDAKRGIAAMTKDHAGVQQSLKDAKNAELGFDENGVMTAKWNNPDGTETKLSFGDPERNGASLGASAGGLDLRAQGSAANIDRLMSTAGDSKARQAAISYARNTGQQAVTDEQGNYGVKNLATGQVQAIGAEGSKDIGNAQSLGNGYIAGNPISTNGTGVMGASSAQGWVSLDHAEKVESAKNAVLGEMGDKGYLENKSAMQTPSANVNMSQYADSLGVGAKNAAIMDSSIGVSHGDGTISANAYGGSLDYSTYDKEASGTKIQNAHGAPIIARVTDAGENNMLGVAFYNAQSGIDKPAASLSDYFANSLELGEGGEAKVLSNLEYAQEYNEVDYASMVSAIEVDDGNEKAVVAELTYDGLTDVTGDDWISGPDGISFRLTEKGKELFKEGSTDISEIFQVNYARRGDEVFEHKDTSNVMEHYNHEFYKIDSNKWE